MNYSGNFHVIDQFEAFDSKFIRFTLESTQKQTVNWLHRSFLIDFLVSVETSHMHSGMHERIIEYYNGFIISHLILLHSTVKRLKDEL